MRALRFGLRAQIIALFLLFSGAVSVLIATSFSEVLKARLLDELKARLLSTVVLGARSLDADALADLMSTGKQPLADDEATILQQTPAFRRLSDQLNAIRATDPRVIRFVYTFVPTTDPNTALYAVDADVLDLLARQAQGEVIDDLLSPLGSEFDLTDYAVARQVLAEKAPGIDQEYVWDNVFQVNSISGYAPIWASNGRLVAVLGIDMTDGDVRESLSQVTLLSGAITGVALVLSLLLSVFLGAFLTRNVLQLRKAVERFGQQDFAARVTLRSRDEIGDLGASFNTMAQTIVDYQDTLTRVERERAEAEFRSREEAARNAENRKYLDHISQGLLLMDEDRIISGQYSRFLVELFRLPTSPAGLDFLDFVYPDAVAAEADRRELAQFLSLLKANTNADPEMIDEVNPFKGKELTVHDGSVIVVDAHFLRVATEGRDEGLMVVFEDKTRIIEAERQQAEERERHEAELEAVAAIVHHGPLLFQDFLRDGESAVTSFSSEAWDTLTPDRVDHYFRLFHSLKGSARALALPKIAEEAHALEDQLAGDRDRLQMEASLFVLQEGMEAIKTIIGRFQAFGSPGSPPSPVQELDQFVATLKDLVTDLGTQLEKAVEFHAAIEVDQLPFLSELKNPLIHLVRNAVDHGIEGLYERVASKKPEKAQVWLEVAKEPGRLVVSVRDDGRGVDYEAIQRAAVRKGLLAETDSPTEAQLLKLLFQPRFSSREKVTDVSGRGMGLDVVAEAVRRRRGKVQVKTKKGRGTTFQIVLPLDRAED